jgi:shikimate kinase
MRNPPLNVILIGFMGCGKTTLGHRLAGLLGFEFVDSDSLIEQRAGKTIPQIFQEVQEEGFRKIEAEVLQSLQDRKGIILSTGGGIVTCPENHAVLKSLGVIVYVSTSEQILWNRIRRDRNRPMMLTTNPRKTFDELLAKRRPLYEGLADLKEDTRGLNPEDSAYGIAESIRVFFAKHGHHLQ